MNYPLKQIFWASFGGAISALISLKSGLKFLPASAITLCALIVIDFLVHTWRIHLFTKAVGKDYDGVRAFVEKHGNSLMIGTRQELKAIYGVAYKLYDNSIFPRRYDHFCLLNGRKEKRTMSKYNLSISKNPAYRIMEFLF